MVASGEARWFCLRKLMLTNHKLYNRNDGITVGPLHPNSWLPTEDMPTVTNRRHQFKRKWRFARNQTTSPGLHRLEQLN
jgi:hypothetical protein